MYSYGDFVKIKNDDRGRDYLNERVAMVDPKISVIEGLVGVKIVGTPNFGGLYGINPECLKPVTPIEYAMEVLREELDHIGPAMILELFETIFKKTDMFEQDKSLAVWDYHNEVICNLHKQMCDYYAYDFKQSDMMKKYKEDMKLREEMLKEQENE